MNLPKARKLVDRLRYNHRKMTPDQIDQVIDEINLALNEPPETLEINVSDSISMGGVFGKME